MTALWWTLENPVLSLLIGGCAMAIAAMLATRLMAGRNPDDTDYNEWTGI